MQAVAKQWLGKTCFCNWPHLKEGLVIGVSDENTYWYLNGDIDKGRLTHMG